MRKKDFREIQHRLEFAEPRSVMEWIRCHGAEDAFCPRQAPEPTRALPGSKEKIDVLAQRIEIGADLWSDDDPKIGMSNKSFWSSDVWQQDNE